MGNLSEVNKSVVYYIYIYIYITPKSFKHKATWEAVDQFILQPQYTDNPQNIYEGDCLYIKSMEVPFCNFEVHL